MLWICSTSSEVKGGKIQNNMSLVVTEKKYALMTEGLHNVTISKVEDLGVVDTKFGAKDRVRIYFTASDQKDEEGKAVDVIMSANKTLGKKTTLSKLLSSLGVEVGSEFDLNDLVGIKCQVVVEHTESEGRTYANIATVLKLRKPTVETI